MSWQALGELREEPLERRMAISKVHYDAVICATTSSSDGVASSAAASCVLLIFYVYDAALFAASGSDHLCIFEGANCLHSACGARVS